MQMNKKALASIFVIALLALGLGYGTMAYYSETEAKAGNIFQSGTNDLSIDGNMPFELKDIKPCDELEPVLVSFRNIGDFDGYLYNKITYSQNDKAVNPPDLTANEFAALIYVKNVTYQHYNPNYPGDHWGSIQTDELDNWELGMDTNSDGNVSLYEIKNFGWIPFDVSTPEEPLVAGEGGRWNITFHMADSLNGHTWGDTTAPDEHLQFNVLDNGPQADGIDMTWTAVLKTAPGPPP